VKLCFQLFRGPKKREQRTETVDVHDITLVALLRGFHLKLQNRLLYNELMALRSRPAVERCSSSYIYPLVLACIRMYTGHVLSKALKIKINNQEVVDLVAIILGLGYTAPELDKSILYIFPSMPWISHSCVPNSDFSVGRVQGDSMKKLCVFSARDISEDEPITVDFLRLQFLRTQERQEHLAKHCKTCSCAKCLDSFELQECLSGLVCFNPNCSGYVYPTPGTGVKPEFSDANWSCDTCFSIFKFALFENNLKKLQNIVLNFIAGRTETKSVVHLNQLLSILKAYCHPKHSLVAALELKIAKLYSFDFVAANFQLPDSIEREDRLRADLGRTSTVLANQNLSMSYNPQQGIVKKYIAVICTHVSGIAQLLALVEVFVCLLQL